MINHLGKPMKAAKWNLSVEGENCTCSLNFLIHSLIRARIPRDKRGVLLSIACMIYEHTPHCNYQYWYAAQSWLGCAHACFTLWAFSFTTITLPSFPCRIVPKTGQDLVKLNILAANHLPSQNLSPIAGHAHNWRQASRLSISGSKTRSDALQNRLLHMQKRAVYNGVNILCGNSYWW